MQVLGVDLQPGDVLLYQGTGFFSWAIRVKTFSPISHVELWRGEGAYASRDGEGVGTYPLRVTDLHTILRPLVPLSPTEWQAIDGAHHGYTGSTYDWWGLFGFFRPSLGVGNDARAFCSEHVARLFKLAGRPLFGLNYPSDKVTPGMFLATPLLDVVWQDTPRPRS